SGLSDGEWHYVRFLAKENFAMLTIDRDEASAVRTNTPVQITTGGTYHFGVPPCSPQCLPPSVSSPNAK
ncbi:contactin-associated protein-like 2 isoform X1, partial [Tachysurus ichikawai]